MADADVAALNQRRAPGNTCISALRWERMGTVDAPLNDSKGCGGVMRIAPVGLSTARADRSTRAATSRRSRTGTRRGYLAAGALAQLIVRDRPTAALARPRARAVERRLRRRWRHEEVLEALQRRPRARRRPATEPAPRRSRRSARAGWPRRRSRSRSTARSSRRDFAHGVRLAVNHSRRQRQHRRHHREHPGRAPRIRSAAVPRGSTGSSSGTRSSGCAATSRPSSSRPRPRP